MSEGDIDRHLDAVLKASGSALRHYSLPGTLAAMRAAMREALKPAGWIACSERMPEFPEKRNIVLCIVASDKGNVTCANWARNVYAKTEKGRAPRWETTWGGLLTVPITHWQPLPAAPQHGGEHE